MAELYNVQEKKGFKKKIEAQQPKCAPRSENAKVLQ